MYKKGLVAALSFLILLLFSSVVYAQIGEIAGHLNFYVQVGGSNSLPFTIANGGSTPVHFVVQPYYIGGVANRTTPTIKIEPTSGTIEPYSQYTLNVTATVPAKNNSVGFLFWQTIPAGLGWSGNLEVVATGSSSVNGGANIEAGVVKIFTITPYTVPPGPIVYAVIAALIVIVAGIVFYFGVYRRRYVRYRPSSKAAAARAKAVAMSKKMRGRRAARKRTQRRKARGARARKATRRRRR